MRRRLTRSRRFPSAKGPTTWSPSPDGKLVIVTNKKDQSVSLVDAVGADRDRPDPHQQEDRPRGSLLARQPLAYVSSESIGADPGAVDVIDLARRKLVATVSVPGQPTGITILRTPSTSARR